MKLALGGALPKNLTLGTNLSRDLTIRTYFTRHTRRQLHSFYSAELAKQQLTKDKIAMF